MLKAAMEKQIGDITTKCGVSMGKTSEDSVQCIDHYFGWIRRPILLQMWSKHGKEEQGPCA
jgi:hypothetical protein